MNSLKRSRSESVAREQYPSNADSSTINVQPPGTACVASSSTEGSPAAKKVRISGRRVKDKNDIPVGYHCEDEGIPVFARVPNHARYEFRIDFRNFVEEIDPNVPQALRERFAAKSRIPIDNVILSDEYFPKYNGDLKTIDSNEKHRLISKLVFKSEASEATILEKNVPDVEEQLQIGKLQTQHPELVHGELRVGTHKHDLDCPVYAHLTRNATAPSLKFQVHWEDAVDSRHEFFGRTSVSFDCVVFAGEFIPDVKDVKGRDEKIKHRIRSLLIQNRQGASTATAQDDSVPIDAGKGNLDITQLDGVLKSLDGARDITQDHLGHYNDLKAKLEAKKQRIAELKSENADMQLELNRANEEMKKLKEENARHTFLATATGDETDKHLFMKERKFTKLQPGDVNAGLYIERFARSTEASGTVYKDKAVLSEYKHLNVGGELKDEVVFDGVTYMRVHGGHHDGKLVQQIGLKSFISFEGKTYVEWNIRVEEKLGFLS